MSAKPLITDDVRSDDTVPPAAVPGASLDTVPPQAGQATSIDVPVQEVIPGYAVLGVLGRGGMGVVYKARHLKLDRVVALKMILSGAHAGEEELARFRDEAKLIARLQHPNVVQVFEVGEIEKTPYLALEYVAGGSLADRLSQGPLPTAEAAHIVALLAHAIHSAHEHGIVHRDLKPANVLLAEDGTPKVTDFGLAKKLDERGRTQTGAFLGTPAYVAPEQARGDKDVGPAADTYALGVILYECLTGRPPFGAESLQATLNQITNEEPRSPRSLVPGLDRGLEAICLRCLEKDVASRYPTAKALADELDRYARGERVTTRAHPFRHWKKTLGRRALPLAGALALLALALIAGGYWLSRPTKDAAPLPAVTGRIDPVREQKVGREVASWRRSPPSHRTSSPLPVREVEELPAPDNSAFEILEDSRVWDLRGWRPIPQGAGPDAVAPVSMTVRLRLKKLGPAAAFVFQAKTTGKDVFMECLSHPAAYRVDAQRQPAFVGKQQVKTRHCVVDVSAVPEQAEFDLRFCLTYLTSFQTPEDRWVGVIGYEHAFETSQLILFPDDRPPAEEPTLRVAPTVRGTAVAFEGEKRTLSDAGRSYFYWEVLNPRQGQVYQVHWKW